MSSQQADARTLLVFIESAVFPNDPRGGLTFKQSIECLWHNLDTIPVENLIIKPSKFGDTPATYLTSVLDMHNGVGSDCKRNPKRSHLKSNSKSR